MIRTKELGNLIGYFVTFGASMIGSNDKKNKSGKITDSLGIGKKQARYLRFVFKL